MTRSQAKKGLAAIVAPRNNRTFPQAEGITIATERVLHTARSLAIPTLACHLAKTACGQSFFRRSGTSSCRPSFSNPQPSCTEGDRYYAIRLFSNHHLLALI